MAVAATDYSGWVKELDHYEASMDDDGDERVETTTSRQRPSSRGGGAAAIGTGRKATKATRSTSVSEELKQEMKLLNWHKLANEAALKAAIIKTNKIKNEDTRFASSLANEDVEEKRQRIQQIIEEEQLRPLQVNTEFFREFEAREQRDDVKTETDVQRHIQHLKKLKETMAQHEDLHRRRHKYKEGMAELSGNAKSHSVPKGHKSSNQEEELGSGPSKQRHYRSMSTAYKAGGGDTANADVLCSLDKLMELEKRIRHLEDAGFGVDELDGSSSMAMRGGASDGGSGGLVREDLDDNNVTSTKKIRFSKRMGGGGRNNEPSRTMYAVKTVSKARAKEPLTRGQPQSTASASAARKRSLSSTTGKPKNASATFLTSLPETKQRQQLRRMTDRERRNFLKTEKQQEAKQQQHKQDVVIHDWMQKKTQAAQQRKQVTSHQQQAKASAAAGPGQPRRGAGKPLPPPPRVKAPLRGAAAGKHIANPQLQKFDDIRKGFDKRKEALSKQPSHATGNKVLALRTAVNDRPHHNKKSSGPTAITSTVAPRGASMGKAPPPTMGAVPAAASQMPSAAYARRHSSGSHANATNTTAFTAKLPAISKATPAPPLPSHSVASFASVGVGNHRSGGSTNGAGTSHKPLPSSGAGVTLPRLSNGPAAAAAARRALPSPPPASTKNPAMPQFSRLHKR